ncbi:fimbrial protein [Delftia acidovorans]|uniref:Fimbrial-type adhesion domain-containing protein n=2 Tax=Pseudomonadati TaxID=3379134 RepID=A0A2G7T5Y6_9FLAO|nr:fimbrial protein [Delftia acidovorans]
MRLHMPGLTAHGTRRHVVLSKCRLDSRWRTRMNMYKLFAFSMGIIFSTISESHAAFCMPADSNPATDGKNHYIASYPVNQALSLPININSEPNGKVFAVISLNPVIDNKRYSSIPARVVCSGFGRPSFSGFGVPDDRIYPSNVPGIGLRMSMEGIGTIPSDRPTLTNSYTIPEGEKSTITIDFIKTGPISTIFGEIQLAGPYMEMKIAGALAAQYVFSGVTLVPINPTCTLVSDSISVPLGTHPDTRFTGLGATTDKVPFSIQLSCSGGDPNTQIKPFVTLSGTTDTQVPSVLALTGSQVSGVGVEVLRNGAIQGFGAANGWQAGTISQGTANFQIDLEARYRQIRNTVSGGGSANALATFTIDYQ